MELLISKVLTVDSVDHLVRVEAPAGGGGGSYHVSIDNYHCGEIVKYSTGWKPMFNPGSRTDLLTPDDIGAIIDAIISHENRI